MARQLAPPCSSGEVRPCEDTRLDGMTQPIGCRGGAMRPIEVLVDLGCAPLWSAIGRALEGFATERSDTAAAIEKWATGPFADASVVLVGRRSADGLPSEDLIRRLRRSVPHVTVCVCLEDASRLRLAAEYAWAGADHVVGMTAPHNVHELRQYITARLAAPPPELEVRKVNAAYTAGEGRTVGLFCLRNGHRRLTVEDLATWFACDRKTISDRLIDAGFPRPHLMIRVGQEAACRELSRRAVASMIEIARRLGLHTAAGLRMRRSRLREARDAALQQLLRLIAH